MLRLSMLFLSSIAPLAVLHSVLAWYLWPVPPTILLSSSLPLALIRSLYDNYHSYLQLVTLYLFLEAIFIPYHSLNRFLTRFSRPQPSHFSTEERWRLWVKMIESAQDPAEWLGGWFLRPTYRDAPGGATDDAIEPDLRKVGRTNVEEWVAEIMFGKKLKQIRPKSLERG